MVLPKFYSMVGQHNKRWAVARIGNNFDDLKLWDLVENLKARDQWRELDFNLDSGALSDLPPTDVIGRVCSPKLAAVIRQFNTDIMWLPVRLRQGDARYVYYFMHFPFIPDVLDEEKTVYAGGRVFSPCISLVKSSRLAVFCLRRLGNSTFVRADVKDAIEKSGCAGIEFEEVVCS